MPSPDAEQSRLLAAYERRSAATMDSWFDPAYRYIRQDRERRVLSLLAREGLTSLVETRILDVGCGRGNWLRELIRWGARPENLFGVDLLADRVESARLLNPPGVTITQGSITALGFPDGAFDVVLQSTAFSSMLDDEHRRRSAAEMRRVVHENGLILWYDFHMDNPSNGDVRAVPRADLRRLFPGCCIRMERITLAPPLARVFAPYSTLLCDLLSVLPFLRTHTLAAIRPA